MNCEDESRPNLSKRSVTEERTSSIQVSCPCCGTMLTIDPSLPAVLSHRPAQKPQMVTQLKDASKVLKAEAAWREEKYQQILEAEKSKGKVLDRKFQELLKKAKEEPLEKPIKDIDLD